MQIFELALEFTEDGLLMRAPAPISLQAGFQTCALGWYRQQNIVCLVSSGSGGSMSLPVARVSTNME